MHQTINTKKFISLLKYVILDIILIFFTYFFTTVLLDFIGINLEMRKILPLLPILIVFKITVFIFFGFYRTLIDHFGFEDIVKMMIIITLSNVTIVVVIYFLRIDYIIKSVFVFITPFEIFFISLPRIYPRIINYFKTNMAWGKALGKRTLIIGAGAAGEIVCKEVYRNKDLNNIPIAFVDDDERKFNGRLMGIKVVGPISDIDKFIKHYNIEEVILAIAHLPYKVEQELFRQVTSLGVRIKKLISISEIYQKDKPIIRDVNVEDLLNRNPIFLDNKGIEAFIKDEVVLITGGGGSIGSELCRQVANLKPKMLIIYDLYENNAYDIQMELLRKFKKDKHPQDLNLVVLIGSVYHYKRLEEVYKTYRPTIVFHAAAYKHVPLMEDSPKEAVRTNVLGTYNAAILANAYDVKKFVLVSSDKAVRSTNIMGATKRFAELIVDQQNKLGKTKFSAVRFGNVLGSNGSVIPLFNKQIADGGPVTVTHKDITRFFMTISESVSLILQSAVYANGGEIFVLDMGEPIKIKDLAEKMIRLAGFKPYEDIDIEITGLRPGEKLYEELLVDHDYGSHKKTENNKIYIESREKTLDRNLNLESVFETFEDLDNDGVKKLVASVIESYKVNGET